jgi:hypothetical protein
LVHPERLLELQGHNQNGIGRALKGNVGGHGSLAREEGMKESATYKSFLATKYESRSAPTYPRYTVCRAFGATAASIETSLIGNIDASLRYARRLDTDIKN